MRHKEISSLDLRNHDLRIIDSKGISYRPILGSKFTHDRFFHVMNEGWFIETREGGVGPFSSHSAAEQFLETLVERQN